MIRSKYSIMLSIAMTPFVVIIGCGDYIIHEKRGSLLFNLKKMVKSFNNRMF